MALYYLSTSEDKELVLSFDEFIGGWIGGIGGLLASHPLDTVKVQLQFHKGTLAQAVLSTYKKGGFLGFYKGVGFPVTMAGVQNAIFFGAYANVYRNLKKRFPDKGLSLILMGGICGGFVQVMATTPVEFIKVKLQTQKEMKAHGIIFNMKDIYLTNGIFGFYRGFVATALRDVPSGGVYISIYIYSDNYFKQFLSSYWSHLLSGGLAGMLSYAPFTPFDVVKTRMQADDLRVPKYKSFRDCVMKSYAAEGITCFWRGFLPSSIRAFISNATVFFVYETCIQILS